MGLGYRVLGISNGLRGMGLGFRCIRVLGFRGMRGLGFRGIRRLKGFGF